MGNATEQAIARIHCYTIASVGAPSGPVPRAVMARAMLPPRASRLGSVR